MIIFNKTLRVIYFEKNYILPGSKKEETYLNKEKPTIKEIIQVGIIEFVED